MKKTLAFVLAISMVFCVCGCKSGEGNNSSESVVIEYESIVVDENGNVASSGTDATSGNSNLNTSGNDSMTANSASSANQNTSAIDYNTIVEVDICDDISRCYLDLTTAKREYDWLSEYSGIRCDYQNLVLNWNFDVSSLYTLYFSENADFSNALIISTSTSTVKNAVLIPGKTYYW